MIKAFEQELIQAWKKEKTYESSDYTFSIDSPPPSISGTPHMGTAFGYILKDIIARYNRMFGERVFYPLGYDDNGLPTEKLVEKKLKKPLRSLEKKEAEEVCMNIINEEEKQFAQIFENMGLSHDENLKYQTIGNTAQKIAQESFIDLYNKKLVYRSFSPIIWDTKDQTALAQSDIVDIESPSTMHYINFKAEKENVVIATTRPELLPSIVAIFCHPDDKRFTHLHNQKITAPLIDVSVPVLTDDKVDMNKGSGLVMCCTFGDTNDIYWWKKHKLDTKVLFTNYGTISNNIAKFCNNEDLNQLMIGKKIIDARKIIVTELTPYIIKSESIHHIVKCAERSKAPIEYLISPQWMLNITSIKDEIRKEVDKIKWHPDHMKNLIYQWIDGISWDWCISRQRSFGVSIPVWYKKGSDDVIISAKTPVNTAHEYPEGHGPDTVDLNNEVFDTWWTSSLTPQINANKLFLDKPMTVRTQGHEIIRTWAFYTIVKSYLHNKIIPWENIFIHGWCLAEDKTKMSKSKGNVISPINIMNQYGADPLRYWAAKSSFGNDTSYSEDTVKLGKKISNKIKNAAIFISNFKANAELNKITHELDAWMIHETSTLRDNIKGYIKSFNYTKAREELDKFFLEVFCDYYIEIVKTRAYNDQGAFSKEESQSAIQTLNYVLTACLLGYGPIMPFTTDHIWRQILNNNQSIHRCNIWNEIVEPKSDQPISNTNIQNMFKVIEDIRRQKTIKKLAMNSPIDTIEIEQDLPHQIIDEIKTALKISNVKIGKQNLII